MNGHVRPGLLARIRARLPLLRPQPEPSLRDSIAELVEEAAQEQVIPGTAPALDRHERLLIANVLRLRETTAADVMVPRADIVAIRADVTLAQAMASEGLDARRIEDACWPDGEVAAYLERSDAKRLADDAKAAGG